MAIYLAVNFFAYFLQDRNFQILTDHQPLIYAMKRNFDDCTGRRLWHLQYISEFTTDIQYIKDKDKDTPDCLSRPSDICAVFQHYETADIEVIAASQTADKGFANLLQNPPSGLNFRRVAIPNSVLSVLVEDSTGIERILIPDKLTKKVFAQVHELAHTGGLKTLELIPARFYWPKMRQQILHFSRSCLALDCIICPLKFKKFYSWP